MKTILCVLACAFVLVGSASAQTHPCDLPDQTTATKGSKLGWCHDMKDGDGLLISGAMGFRVSVNGTMSDLGLLSPLGTPNATGLYYFEATLPNAARGLYPVAVLAYDAGGLSSPSVTISWQVGGPPNRPQKPRIAKLTDWLRQTALAYIK